MWRFKTKAAAKLAVKHSAVLMSLGKANWISHSYRALAKEVFGQNPIVNSCVSRIARASSSVELGLYDYTRQGKLRKIDRHVILDLIDSPNPMWSGRQFREKAATQYLIGGEAFLLGNNGQNTPSELWLLLPDAMTVDVPNAGLLPRSYTYRAGGEKTYPVNPVTGMSEVLHLRTVNPLDEWRGLPPLAAAAHGVDVFNAGQEWNKSLLQNECRPSGALQMRQGKDGYTQELSEEQFNRLREEVDSQFSGAGNDGRRCCSTPPSNGCRCRSPRGTWTIARRCSPRPGSSPPATACRTSS